MGTLHENTHPLHGMTVLVELASGEVWIGRCHEWDERALVLRDADRSPPGDEERVRWLAKASRFGVWPRHALVRLESRSVVSVQRLFEVGAEVAPVETPSTATR